MVLTLFSTASQHSCRLPFPMLKKPQDFLFFLVSNCFTGQTRVWAKNVLYSLFIVYLLCSRLNKSFKQVRRENKSFGYWKIRKYFQPLHLFFYCLGKCKPNLHRCTKYERFQAMALGGFSEVPSVMILWRRVYYSIYCR